MSAEGSFAGDRLSGQFQPTTVSPVASGTVVSATAIERIDCTAGAVGRTMPNPANVTDRIFEFIKTDASVNAATIYATINGAANKVLANQWDYLRIQSTGAAYVRLGGNV